MKAVLFSFTRRGARLSISVLSYLKLCGWQVRALTGKKFISLDSKLEELEPDLGSCTGQAFSEAELLVFIGASGIAVRSIAPYIKSKTTDPAVLVIDEKGQYVIPLLSGHIGGANQMSRKLAGYLHGQPVITTATDVNHLFAVDEWAARNHMVISSMREAKAFSAGLLDGGPVGVYSDFPVEGALPEGLEMQPSGPLGMAVTLSQDCYPFAETVVLRPRIIHLGIGCRKDTPEEAISRLVLRELRRLRISLNLVADIATIDIKKQETGLLHFARNNAIPIHFYSAEQLNAAPGLGFASSRFVQKTTGTDNVCERAAVLASRGGRLLLHKTVRDGVTLAIACEEFCVNFEMME